MTKEEITVMTNNEELTDLAVEILLKNLNPAMLRSAIRAEVAEIDEQIKVLEAQGWAVRSNGSWHANWAKAEELNGWNLTPEQEAEYDAAWFKCGDVEKLIYRRNRVTALQVKI